MRHRKSLQMKIADPEFGMAANQVDSDVAIDAANPRAFVSGKRAAREMHLHAKFARAGKHAGNMVAMLMGDGNRLYVLRT